MTKYAGDGRAILAAVKTDINQFGTEMEVNAAYDHLPVEHRARIRNERTIAIRTAREEARRDLAAWASETRAAATKRMTKTLGTSAEESRRVAEELKIGRLVADGRGNRNAASDLEERAVAAYAKGDRSEARVLAQAARELQPLQAQTAREIILNIEADEVLEDPTRAAAARELADIDVVVSVFERDTAAATSKAIQQSAALAKALGDGAEASAALQEASADGRRAKMAAFAESQRAGVPYVEPEGVIPGLPQNLDPRGVPQPVGAHLGGGTTPA